MHIFSKSCKNNIWSTSQGSVSTRHPFTRLVSCFGRGILPIFIVLKTKLASYFFHFSCWSKIVLDVDVRPFKYFLSPDVSTKKAGPCFRCTTDTYKSIDQLCSKGWKIYVFCLHDYTCWIKRTIYDASLPSLLTNILNAEYFLTSWNCKLLWQWNSPHFSLC